MRVSLPALARLRQMDVHKLMLRAALLWLAARLLAVAATGVWLMSNDIPLSARWFVSLTTAFILIAATAVMSHIDSRFMREPIFYANITRPAWSAAAVGAATAALFEILTLVIA